MPSFAPTSPELARDAPSPGPAQIPHVAVLLAAYNGIAHVEDLLASVFGQEGVSVTVFASVDASTDGTEAYFQLRAADDPRVVLLPTGQRFGSACSNFLRLLREVDFDPFDHVALADQDDIWLPNKLLRANQILAESGCDGYSSNVLAFWPDGRQLLIDKAHAQKSWDFLFEGGAPGCTFVLRRSLALEIRALARAHPHGIEGIDFHDWLIYAYARGHGRRWIIDQQPGLLYRQHAANFVGANSGWRAFGARALAVLRGKGLAQALTLARVVGIGDDPFVRAIAAPGRMRYLRLALHAAQCRRRQRDQLLFALACVCLFILGERG